MFEQRTSAEQPSIPRGDSTPTNLEALKAYLDELLKKQGEYEGPDLPC